MFYRFCFHFIGSTHPIPMLTEPLLNENNDTKSIIMVIIILEYIIQ